MRLRSHGWTIHTCGQQADYHWCSAIVYRPYTFIGIGNADVPIMHFDGQPLARIRIGGYVNVPLSRRRHKLATAESLLGSDTGRVRGETVFSALAELHGILQDLCADRVSVGVPVIPSGDYRFACLPEAETLSELANTNPRNWTGRPMSMSIYRGSFCPDVCLANGAAVVVVSLAKVTSETRAACSDWKERLGDKPPLDVGRLQRCGEPGGELRCSFLRCLRRSP